MIVHFIAPTLWNITNSMFGSCRFDLVHPVRKLVVNRDRGPQSRIRRLLLTPCVHPPLSSLVLTCLDDRRIASHRIASAAP